MAMDAKTALLKAERAVLERKKSEKEAKQAEQEVDDSDSGFSYTGSGGRGFNLKSSGKSAKTSGKLKKLAPVLIFVVLILVVIILIISTTSLLPGHFNANTDEAFGTLYPAVEVAIENTVEVAMENGSLPSTLADNLTDNGLEVGYLDGNGEFIAGLRPNLDSTIALASATDSESSPDRSLVIRFEDALVTFANIRDYLDTDTQFYAKFRDAIGGHASIQFTDSANQFYAQYMNNNRDPFAGYVSTGNNEKDTEAFYEAYSKIFNASANSTLNTAVDITDNFTSRQSSNIFTQNVYSYPGCEGGSEAYSCNGDTNWNRVYGCYHGLERMLDENTVNEVCYDYKKVQDNPEAWDWVLKDGYSIVNTPELAAAKYGELHGVSVMKGVDEEGNTRYFANVLQKSASAAQGIDSYLSLANNMSFSINSALDADYKTAALISQAVSNNETMLSMETFLTYESCINKMMAGEGYGCPINQILNELTTPYTTIDASGNEVTGAAVQEPGLAAVLTRAYGSNLAEEVHASSVDRAIEKATVAFLELTGTEIAANGDMSPVSSITDAMKKQSLNNTKTNAGSYITDFGCYFIGKIQDISAKSQGAIVASITPSISKSIIFGGADKLKGKALGATLSIGGSGLGNKLAQFIGGGTTSDEAGVVAYQQTVDRVLARDAAADRLTSSPFDVTNPNTFFGSIASKLSSVALSSDSFFGLLSGIRNITSTSLASIVPGASAAGGENKFRTIFGDGCSENGYGAAGTVYCTTSIAFDIDYIDGALTKTDFDSFLESNFEVRDEDDEKTVLPKTGSDAELFMIFNNGRQSNFGDKNNNIYNKLSDSSDKTVEYMYETAGLTEGISWIQNAWKSIRRGAQNIVGSIVDFFTQSQNSDGKTNIVNQNTTENRGVALEFSSTKEKRNERIERISTGEEYMVNGSYWDTYQKAQAYSIYSLASEIIGLYSEENENTASLSKFFPSGVGSNPATSYTFAALDIPEDETDAEYLSRISGLTVDEAEYALNYTTVVSYLANFDYDSVEDFCDPDMSEYTHIALENVDVDVLSRQAEETISYDRRMASVTI